MSLNVIILFVFMSIGTLFITYFASKKTKTADSFYTAGGGLTARQNGLALAGDFMSASTFLGLIGAFALTGYDAFFLMYGALVSFLMILFLVAEPLRNLGKFTLGDMITARFKYKQIRGVTAFNTMIISIFYMLGQLVAAGALFKLLLGIPYNTSVILVGIMMLVFVLFGGMTATSWVQIIKAVLLIAGTVVLFMLVMWRLNFDFLGIFTDMKTATPFGPEFLNPGVKYASGLEAASLTSIVITIISISLSLYLQSFNVTFLAVLALTLAASSNLPVILLTIFWKKFNKTGAVTGMLVGLISTIGLIALSPNVWNPVPGAALFTGEPIFPLASPGIVSVPLGFLACYIGTLIGARKQPAIEDNFSEILVKTNTGNDVKGIAQH